MISSVRASVLAGLCLWAPGIWAQTAATPAPAAEAKTSAPAYALRHGDTLLVSVWREEALQKEVRVLPDGSITFPLAGRIEVAGLSSTEVEKRVADKLKAYIPDPVVSVVITELGGNQVYVLGKVLKPGPIQLSSRDSTVLHVLSQAGGLDKFADGGGVRVLRDGPQGTQVLSINYDRLIKGDSLNSNIRLQAGDTILVP